MSASGSNSISARNRESRTSTDAEAAAVVAKDRESNGRDLLTAIDGGDFPRWTLFIQVMTEAQAKRTGTTLRSHQVWPKAQYR